MSESATAMRRWLGVFSLAVGSGMLIWGRTILQPHLEGVLFILYWSVFGLSTCSAIAIGIVDLLFERSRAKAEQARLLAETLADLDEAAGHTPPVDGRSRRRPDTSRMAAPPPSTRRSPDRTD